MDLQSTQDTLNCWDEVNLCSIQGCLCWWECCNIDIICQQNYGTSNQSIYHKLGRPGLFLQREHTMPKAALKLAAAPSTPPASISETPVAVHKSSIPTTISPLESTEATWPSLIMETQKREAESIIVDKCPQPTELESWKSRFKTEASHSAQYPRAAMLWIGEIEDAQSMDELITSASLTGGPILDFENCHWSLYISHLFTRVHCTHHVVDSQAPWVSSHQ